MDKKRNALKAEHWKQVLYRCNLARQQTGIRKTEWCNQNGIGVKSLYRWQKALRLEAAENLLPAAAPITGAAKTRRAAKRRTAKAAFALVGANPGFL